LCNGLTVAEAVESDIVGPGREECATLQFAFGKRHATQVLDEYENYARQQYENVLVLAALEISFGDCLEYICAHGPGQIPWKNPEVISGIIQRVRQRSDYFNAFYTGKLKRMTREQQLDDYALAVLRLSRPGPIPWKIERQDLVDEEREAMAYCSYEAEKIVVNNEYLVTHMQQSYELLCTMLHEVSHAILFGSEHCQGGGFGNLCRALGCADEREEPCYGVPVRQDPIRL